MTAFTDAFSESTKLTIPGMADISSNLQAFGNTSNDLGDSTNILTSDLNIGGAGGEEGMFSGFFSNAKGGQGWGSAAIGAASGVAQSYLGFQQLSEGRKQNRISNKQWQDQFDIQKGEYDRRASERNERVVANKAAKTSIGG
jgi:hypothetical protein